MRIELPGAASRESAARARRVLFISNGHGEDNHSAHVIRALRELVPDVSIAALPIVGHGAAYRAIGAPVIGPTLDLPSGGFTRKVPRLVLGDLRAGLVGLTLGQLRALRRAAPQVDLVFATGDTVAQAFAWVSGRPFLSFISPLSALYEGVLRIEPILRVFLRSGRCRAVITRDRTTATDLRRQGFDRVHFGGIPSLDFLVPSGRDLGVPANRPVVALLPGSRMPEADRNLALMLELVAAFAAASGPPVAFRAALVPPLMAELPRIAAAAGWRRDGPRLVRDDLPGADFACHDDAFADILHTSTAVVGMAGLAVDQAVALGRPVLQIPGEGPQFTAAFAEAQERLLGISARTVPVAPTRGAMVRQGVEMLREILDDAAYRAACAEAGPARLGSSGAARRIVSLIAAELDRTAAAPRR